MVAVAFVCLGNICRSPMAEAVFRDVVAKSNLLDDIKIDSFGTGAYHVGDNPDHRSARTCRKNGVPVSHKAQQIFPHHFTKFDYICAMDESNLSNLRRLAPRNSTAKVSLFGDYRVSPEFERIVDDPYYGGDRGFEHNFLQCQDFARGLLKVIREEHQL